MASPRSTRQPKLGKLRPPRLGRVFGRDRLFAQLDGAASLPGVWVAGPPGIGKTTLVATYLEARGIPACGCSSMAATPTSRPSCTSCALPPL